MATDVGVGIVRSVRTAIELRDELEVERRAGRTIAFVPTMGALHGGHLSLVRLARAAADVVVVSIFVNPLQFGPNDDFESYPRDEEGDLRAARSAGVDVVFTPGVTEIYPEGDSTIVSVGSLATVLEGEERPGHFDGVATVVARLFNLVRPHIAVFGQKDAQQVAVVKRMTSDLRFDIEIAVGPTIREPDGLALSSRNRYLPDEERSRATALFEALRMGRELVTTEELESVEKRMWDLISERGLQPSYARIVDPVTFAPAAREDPKLLVVAARLGPTRLIDNVLVE